MEINGTRIFQDNFLAYQNKSIRRAINQGGTSSTKTYSILQCIILILTFSTVPLIASVVAESIPHLKRGALRDFQKIMGSSFNYSNYNKTDLIYRFKNGSILEFFSADNATKLRGGRRHILFLNEANNISVEAHDELDIRTEIFTFIDFNPTFEFWAHTYKPEDTTAWIHSTYLDALKVLPASVVKNIEARRNKDPNWWNVYGLGLIGNVEGLVHPLFTQVNDIPDLSISNGKEMFGLDFGYTNSPTALIYSVIDKDNIYSDQLIYETGLKNNQINDRMLSLGMSKAKDKIYADCEAPKDIDELYDMGWNIVGCPKPRGSVKYGIQLVNQYNQFWTTRSIDCIKEQRNYSFIRDRANKITNEPLDDFNHGMDARRYSVMMTVGDKEKYVAVQRQDSYARR